MNAQIIAATELINGMTKVAKKILTDIAKAFYGEDDPNVLGLESESFNPFYFFMVEYAFNATIQDIEEGIIQIETLMDVDLLSKALCSNFLEFAYGFVTNPELANDIADSFQRRVAILDKEPWFINVQPYLCFLWENASKVNL